MDNGFTALWRFATVILIADVICFVIMKIIHVHANNILGISNGRKIALKDVEIVTGFVFTAILIIPYIVIAGIIKANFPVNTISEVWAWTVGVINVLVSFYTGFALERLKTAKDHESKKNKYNRKKSYDDEDDDYGVSDDYYEEQNDYNDYSPVKHYTEEKKERYSEDVLKAYALEEWQKELVRKGDYDPWDFDEDDIDEDSYYYGDSGHGHRHGGNNNKEKKERGRSFDEINK